MKNYIAILIVALFGTALCAYEVKVISRKPQFARYKYKDGSAVWTEKQKQDMIAISSAQAKESDFVSIYPSDKEIATAAEIVYDGKSNSRTQFIDEYNKRTGGITVSSGAVTADIIKSIKGK